MAFLRPRSWILILLVISAQVVSRDTPASEDEDEADDDFNYYGDDQDSDNGEDDFLEDEFGYGDVYTFEDDQEGFASSSSSKVKKPVDIFAKDDFQLARDNPGAGGAPAGLLDDHKEFNPRDKHPGAGLSNGHDRMDKTHTNLIHDQRYDGDQYVGHDVDDPPYRSAQSQLKGRKTAYDPDFDGSHVNHIPYQPAAKDKKPFGGGFRSAGAKPPVPPRPQFGAARPMFGAPKSQFGVPKPAPPFMKATIVRPPAQETDFYEPSDSGGGLHFASGKDKIQPEETQYDVDDDMAYDNNDDDMDDDNMDDEYDDGEETFYR